MKTDYKFISKDELTELAKSSGINSWMHLTEFIKNLPYGRNKNRTDLGLVLSEKKGSCSSKHALLKKIADLNNIPNVKLILGIYKMNVFNTPKIGNELSKNSIEYIPEAHCYLKINDEPVDFTNVNSEFGKLKKDIIKEIEIEPNQVSAFKVDYHKNYLKSWLLGTKSEFEFEEIWKIRENCIKNLAQTQLN